jgi:hypothetical protein
MKAVLFRRSSFPLLLSPHFRDMHYSQCSFEPDMVTQDSNVSLRRTTMVPSPSPPAVYHLASERSGARTCSPFREGKYQIPYTPSLLLHRWQGPTVRSHLARPASYVVPVLDAPAGSIAVE